MGRKKLNLKYIENYTSRKFTFKSRIGGVVKKLHDLSILCGIQASLVVTDHDGNLVTYSNNQDIQLLVKDSFN